MKNGIIATLFVAGTILVGCGTAGDDPTLTAGDGPEAVVAEGSDSQVVEEGDQRPEGESGPASVVEVTVGLPPDTELVGKAIITLEDISLADTESVEIARVEMPIAELAAQDHRVQVFLPLPLDGSVDVNAAVHLDIDENGSFSPGDWISPGLALVTPESASNIVIDVVPI